MFEITEESIDAIEKEMGVCFDEARRAALKGWDDIQACPGSGKTTMVAAKLLLLAEKWTSPYQGICVLTHTNVAKNEIIAKLNKNKIGSKLLLYPHFIGTIQEFVNKFLAIPYLRSIGHKVTHVDDDLSRMLGWRWLSYNTKAYLQRKHIDSINALQFLWQESELVLGIPGFKQVSQTSSCLNLIEVKKKLCHDGVYFYREMFEFAQANLHSNEFLINAIRLRFPCVFIDEMQDTQKYQDDLLGKIFNHDSVFYQRFGDPDQAIYGEKDEENTTYNSQNLKKIEDSHRFHTSIAEQARRLSCKRIDLVSSLTDGPISMNTIFLIDDQTRSCVFKPFAELCVQQVPRECKDPIKTVGAVGIKKDDGLSIGHYYLDYEKNQAINSFRSERLIEYFWLGRQNLENLNITHDLIIDGICYCARRAELRLPESNDVFMRFTSSNVKLFLKKNNIRADFNSILMKLLMEPISLVSWEEDIVKLFRLICAEPLSRGSTFFEYVECTDSLEGGINPLAMNQIVIEYDDRSIVNEITTIHSVKGETHAATLVLENKFHQYDSEKLINYILGLDDKAPTKVRTIKFMKQFYVAFSRPKYLLCLAMDKSRFPTDKIVDGKLGGWSVVDLTK